MPYIGQATRTKLDPCIDSLATSIAAEAIDAGEEVSASGFLTYSITRLILSVFRILFHNFRYWNLALNIGVLETAKLEMYRKAGVPLENIKCDLNGDIPEFEALAESV